MAGVVLTASFQSFARLIEQSTDVLRCAGNSVPAGARGDKDWVLVRIVPYGSIVRLSLKSSCSCLELFAQAAKQEQTENIGAGLGWIKCSSKNLCQLSESVLKICVCHYGSPDLRWVRL